MSEILERRPVRPDRLVRYGEMPQQYAEIRFPKAEGRNPLLFVIHGGFWQNMYDLSHISHLCAALTKKGIVTCSLEYRRVGDPGGGWTGTFRDVCAATDRVVDELRFDSRVDIDRTGILGHSAGGHLALWLTSNGSIPETSELYFHSNHHISRGVSLAGVADLRKAWQDNLGNGAVAKLMGGSPEKLPERYRAGSPIELLPTESRQILVHGVEDRLVPISQSEKFVESGKTLGCNARLVRLKGIGHFELIDPESDGWDPVEHAVMSLFDGEGKK